MDIGFVLRRPYSVGIGSLPRAYGVLRNSNSYGVLTVCLLICSNGILRRNGAMGGVTRNIAHSLFG